MERDNNLQLNIILSGVKIILTHLRFYRKLYYYLTSYFAMSSLIVLRAESAEGLKSAKIFCISCLALCTRVVYIPSLCSRKCSLALRR